MPRRCTVITGTIDKTASLSVELVLSGDMALCLGRRILWVPRQSIEGGALIRTGDTDPAISNWWLKARGIIDLVKKPTTPNATPATGAEVQP